MMAFIGVRISWLMFARNMDFIWVASSALPLACLEGALLLLALRDVADGHRDLRALALLRGKGAEPDLHGERRAILAQGEQLAAGTHRTRGGRPVKALAQALMTRAHVVRHEHLDRLADELGRG